MYASHKGFQLKTSENFVKCIKYAENINRREGGRCSDFKVLCPVLKYLGSIPDSDFLLVGTLGGRGVGIGFFIPR